MLALIPAVAWAHDDEEAGRSYDLVRQAIALIVNTPRDVELIADKIDDALGAEDPSRGPLAIWPSARCRGLSYVGVQHVLPSLREPVRRDFAVTSL